MSQEIYAIKLRIHFVSAGERLAGAPMKEMLPKFKVPRPSTAINKAFWPMNATSAQPGPFYLKIRLPVARTCLPETIETGLLNYGASGNMENRWQRHDTAAQFNISKQSGTPKYC